jgi:hypothetical protein
MKPSSLPSIVVSFSSTESESQCSRKTKLENLDRPAIRLPAIAAALLCAAAPGIPQDSSIPEKVAPPENATEQREQAAAQAKDGVIRPPGNVDPDMTVKPSDNNTTGPLDRRSVVKPVLVPREWLRGKMFHVKHF